MSSTDRIGPGDVEFALRKLRGLKTLGPLSLAHVRSLDPLGNFVYS